MRGAAPPSFPVSPRPGTPCLPGSQLQGSLLPGHQEGVGKLCVSQLPHLLGMGGRDGSGSRLPPPPGTVVGREEDHAPGTIQTERQGWGACSVAPRSVQPSKGALSWPRSTEQTGPGAPGTLADKPAQGEVQTPNKGVTKMETGSHAGFGDTAFPRADIEPRMRPSAPYRE